MPITAKIRRNRIFQDGYLAFKDLSKAGLKNKLKVVFIDQFGNYEAGIDEGGLFKDFLDELCKEVFNPDRGLFSVTSEQMVYPNPNSEKIVGKEHLNYFYFIGAVVGRALYEGILLETKFAYFFLRKMQGKHNYLSELQSLDEEMYKNMKFVKAYEGDVKNLCLTFSVDEQITGSNVTVDLVPAGRNITVTNSNKFDYIY